MNRSLFLITLLGTAVSGWAGSRPAHAQDSKPGAPAAVPPSTTRATPSAPHPLSTERREQLKAELQRDLERLTGALKTTPSVDLYSQRGDVNFFLGRFQPAVDDYEKMVEMDMELGPGHWRRGIARFYAGQFTKAAEQFEQYHSFDDVDRENGIWRFFSQHKAHAVETARAGLLKYRKDDREPFPAVYRLFSGDEQPDALIIRIRETQGLTADEREKRLFYAQLYVGLNHAITGREAAAIPHLREATANTWGPEAGYGPRYMWHVGRLHYEQLVQAARPAAAGK